MNKITDIVEKIQNGGLQDGDLESLTPEELAELEELAFDAEEAADEITGGNTTNDEDDDDHSEDWKKK